MVFDVFIRRPVFATVLSLIVLLIGLVSYTRLTVREYPNIDEPQVSVRTDYPGASAEIIETQVTQVLENSIAGIEGIEVITSSSRQERSQISVTFRADADPDVAASDVRDRVGRVRGRLPEAVDEPVISKVEADAQPVLYLALTSDRHSALEISDFADRFVSERLRNSPGVAEVRILGERRYAMQKAELEKLKADIDEEAWESLNSDVSRPFAKPRTGRIAVKVINHLGDEVMKVFRVE